MQHRIYEAPDVAFFLTYSSHGMAKANLGLNFYFFLISQNKQISETCLSAGILYSMWLCLAYLYILEIINFLGSGTIFKEILITGIATGVNPQSSGWGWS